MKIQEYLSERGRQSEIASKTGLAPAFVNQIAKGKKPVPLAYCSAIEVATDGQVTRQDLRPDDWHLIWPELAQKEEVA